MNDLVHVSEKLAPADVLLESREKGEFVLRSAQPLQAYARCTGEWLERWAREAPERTFLAERRNGGWSGLSYREVRKRVGCLAQGLLELDIPAGRPVLMLSDVDIDQALLSLAALHVGIPVATVSVAYSRNTAGGCSKLKAIIEVLEPAVIFVSDGDAYYRAVELVKPNCLVVAARNAQEIESALPLPMLYKDESPAVMEAFGRVTGDTPARYLMTSGSTGEPKAVVNTHRMLCANQQAIAQCWPFLETCEVVVLDWLPWSHTFGANHNFNLVLRNGGTLYIDDGRPIPGQIERTVENIKAVKPTLFFNVPRGYEALLPYLERDEALARALFGRLELLFYAAAALPSSTWERLMACAGRVRKEPLFFSSEWGATETSPVLTNVHYPIDRPGNIGLPVPGIEIKFVPSGDKQEMRVRGPSVFSHYLNNLSKTAEAFDDEGFYKIGDAGRLVDPDHPEKGILFDGRVTEDFKLTTGTWVSVGVLRPKLVSALAPYASDCVICGHDQDVIGALIYPTPALRELAGEAGKRMTVDELAQQPEVRLALCAGLQALAKECPASSQHAVRLLVLDSPPSLEAGEITDKGYINQRTALSLRADVVKRLYAESLDPAVILLAEAYGETV
ncbi:feruloyl-CoA synthase [Azotobacter vinelandii CA]|uniref:AMP-dependent synthetase and ligase n=2 Tax=Azotobacter vinelandii TaxID=354 RepID=C1DF12_AZOVD|nr:feruloyl-CoA synthase [Azotobacter vinelandii]ACO80341.1 AMP-dependent synthetase and ligase [Azotobacter vinelandii DJ]AGK12560.1 feruloyl-CoA synthase [Azotobacter vinelandii CA]AGK21867.1 feruloyl-CoA synthase [Azotobacter vinelandii CA6]SFY26387.1 feruloyl-CoA synthase [Azotobacter vinelandii]GLK61496.1 feruloyl-CoA synthase [Azotobacter vinelandii]